MTPAHIAALIVHMEKIDTQIAQPDVRKTMEAARKALKYLAKENTRLWDEICDNDGDY